MSLLEMSYWFEPVGLYCERQGAGIFSEPLNLFSNFGFIIAGSLILSNAKYHFEVKKLAWLLCLVGIGSLLFHAFDNRLTQLADVVPIGILIVAFFHSFFRFQLELTKKEQLKEWLVFLVLLFIPPLVMRLNGSENYVGCGLMLLRVSYLVVDRKLKNKLLLASLLFGLALTFRSIDLLSCTVFPIGSHFCWHLLNSYLLYKLIPLCQIRSNHSSV